MSNRPFEYDESLVSLCASSRLATFVSNSLESAVTGTSDSGDEACQKLLQQHASHYGRSLDFNDSSVSRNGDKYQLSRRMHRFVSNVVLVHQHNRKLKQDSSSTKHQIGLNQFADLEEHELPLLLSDEEDFAALDSIWTGDIDAYVDQLFDGASSAFIRLEDEESILGAVSEIPVLLKHHKHHKNRIKGLQTHSIKVPKSFYDRYPSLKVAEDLDVSDYTKYTDEVKHNDENYDDNNLRNSTDDFDKYLNWATKDNPDGVGIVHPVMDQGTCGSCWAFAATGTLEASASRRTAFETFTDVLQQSLPDSSQKVHERALMFAQESEKNTLAIANLSVQELVDCDTAVDQGCTGGNPLLAFYFIHRFGLTSWENYPYVGGQGKCRVHRVAEPIATVQSWGILTPNHESNMELVLRYIGPIAVGINGADPTFLAYTGGVYANEDCSQAANHALLIIGLGEETSHNGSVVKYWIARNTWGAGWGENGYVRVKRGDGKKGQPGVCGLAKNPSVALGGMLLGTTDISKNTRFEAFRIKGRSQLENSRFYAPCQNLGLGKMILGFRFDCVMEYYKAAVFGLASVVVVAAFVVWPLSSECRARRRRRRRRKIVRQREETKIPSNAELSPLVDYWTQPLSYGASLSTPPRS